MDYDRLFYQTKIYRTQSGPCHVRAIPLRVKRILLLLGGTTSGVILAECILLIVGISYPLPYIPDLHTGTRLQPGFEAWFHKEGQAHVRINRAGFRDREHARKKPSNTFRIAVLGDSYAEAVQVPLENTFWSVLKRELHKCDALAGKTVEVLNFGVSGYGTAQEFVGVASLRLGLRPGLGAVGVYNGQRRTKQL